MIVNNLLVILLTIPDDGAVRQVHAFRWIANRSDAPRTVREAPRYLPPIAQRAPPGQENLRHFELARRDEDLSAVIRLDMSFHRLILSLSGHPAMESVWLPLMGGMRLPYSRHKSLMESHAEHQQIVNAIQSGPLRSALAALQANIH